MRLLFVFSSYPVETFAIAEVEALRSQGIDVTPLSLRGGRRWLWRNHANRDRHHDRVAVVPLTSLRVWAAFFHFFRRHPLATLRQIGMALRENALQPGHLIRSLYVCLKAPAVAELVCKDRIDAVHVFWAHYPALIIPFVKRVAPAVPVTAFLGAYSLVARIPSGPRVLAEADLLTTHFDGHVPELRNGWLRRYLPVALIYRGLDLESLQAPARDPADGARLVVVSRLEADKNVEDGLRAFALVHRKHPELRLDVIGDGPSRKALKCLARDLGVETQVIFHGLLPHDRAVTIVAGASALLMPSLSPFDFYPNALKEAMALGVPCAGYAIEGVAGYDLEGHALRLARPGRVEELAQAAADLIEDRELARHISSRAMTRVRDFDIRTTSARQAELFHALVEQAPLPAWVLAVPVADSDLSDGV